MSVAYPFEHDPARAKLLVLAFGFGSHVAIPVPQLWVLFRGCAMHQSDVKCLAQTAIFLKSVKEFCLGGWDRAKGSLKSFIDNGLRNINTHVLQWLLLGGLLGLLGLDPLN